MSYLKEKNYFHLSLHLRSKDVDSYVHGIRTKLSKNLNKRVSQQKKNWKIGNTPHLKKQLITITNYFPIKVKSYEFRDIKKYLIDDIESYKIIFVDGKYCSHLSETTHDGMDICVLSSALTQSKYDLIIENYFDKISKKDGITSLNTAFSSEGSYIHIPKNIQVDKPIQIIRFSTGKNESVMFQPRNLIVVDENSHVEIIERFQSINEDVFVNSVSEIYCNKKSIVKHYKIQNDNKNASLVDNTFVGQRKK